MELLLGVVVVALDERLLVELFVVVVVRCVLCVAVLFVRGVL